MYCYRYKAYIVIQRISCHRSDERTEAASMMNEKGEWYICRMKEEEEQDKIEKAKKEEDWIEKE